MMQHGRVEILDEWVSTRPGFPRYLGVSLDPFTDPEARRWHRFPPIEGRFVIVTYDERNKCARVFPSQQADVLWSSDPSDTDENGHDVDTPPLYRCCEVVSQKLGNGRVFIDHAAVIQDGTGEYSYFVGMHMTAFRRGVMQADPKAKVRQQ